MPAFLTSLVEMYLNWVKANPILSAVAQFAILGTFGEVISKWIIRRSFRYPFTFLETLWKMITWSLLAVGIKYAFKGYIGFVEYLEEHNMLPELSKLGKAFAISAFMNLQFGLFLVLAHRVLDNLGAAALGAPKTESTSKKHNRSRSRTKTMNWSGLDKSFLSLVWFWIPAHTITFLQSDDLRIGLAALWSLVLGLILGMFNRRK